MKNRKRLFNVLLFIFIILVLFIPLSFCVYNISPILFVIIIILVFILFKSKLKIKGKKIITKFKNHYSLIIFLIALILRVGIVLLLSKNITQTSDFATALNSASLMDFTSDYHRVFTHWILYPVIINGIFKIFGSSQMTALLFNAIILSICAVLMYLISLKIIKNKNISFISTLIYIFWPANLFYVLIFTPEHICQLLLLLSINLFFSMEDKFNLNNIKNKLSAFILCIIIGICLGLSTFFKNFAPVIIISIAIYFIMNDLKNKVLFKDILLQFSKFIIIILIFSGTRFLTFKYLDNLATHKVIRNVAPCYLNVGLKGQGTYNYEYYNEYFTKLKEYNYNNTKTNSYILKELKNHYLITENIGYYFQLFKSKLNILFGGDTARISWIHQSFNDKNDKIAKNISRYSMKSLNEIFYINISFLMLMGLIYLWNSKNLRLFLLYLIVYGSSLMLLLVEAQNRYMYAIQPLFSILSGAGIYIILKIIKNKKNIKKYLV